MMAFALLLLASGGKGTAIRGAGGPNIVVFLAGRSGLGRFLSVHGNTNLATPHIDSLAKDGALFERFFVCPVCSPTRAEFLTGRYHARGGVRGVSTGQERLDLDETTIARDVQGGAGTPPPPSASGTTACSRRIIRTTAGSTSTTASARDTGATISIPPLEHNGQFVRGKGFMADDFTDHAIGVHRAAPRAAVLLLSAVQHAAFADAGARRVLGPVQGQGADAAALREPQQEDVTTTRAALAMCENIDWNVGRVLAKLDELKLAENTIVLYFCDNGPNSWRWNGGMKGRKGSTDEGGVRSPL